MLHQRGARGWPGCCRKMTVVHHASLKAYYVLGSHATLIRCNWRDDGPVGGYGELKFILTCNKMKPLHVM